MPLQMSARGTKPATSFYKHKSPGSTVNTRSSMIDAIKLKLHSDHPSSRSGQGAAVEKPLMKAVDQLAGYSQEELDEYRQVFNMFDTDRSGAIGLDELESAMKNFGLDPSQEDLEQIIDETHEISFPEFCDVMRRLTAKKSSWNEVIKECFVVFDRSESGAISKKDFQFILRELGDINDNSIIDEIFAEVDVDGNGLIDYDEDYLTDDDIN